VMAPFQSVRVEVFAMPLWSAVAIGAPGKMVIQAVCAPAGAAAVGQGPAAV
jgi:hypothetical protein